MTCTIDYSAFPHIVERIVALSSRSTLFSVRKTCKKLKDRADDTLAQHIAISSTRFLHTGYVVDDDDDGPDLILATRHGRHPALYPSDVGLRAFDGSPRPFARLLDQAAVIDICDHHAFNWYINRFPTKQATLRCLYQAVKEGNTPFTQHHAAAALTLFTGRHINLNRLRLPVDSSFGRLVVNVYAEDRALHQIRRPLQAKASAALSELTVILRPEPRTLGAVGLNHRMVVSAIRSWAAENRAVQVTIVGYAALLEYFEFEHEAPRTHPDPELGNLTAYTYDEYRGAVGEKQYALETDFGYYQEV